MSDAVAETTFLDWDIPGEERGNVTRETPKRRRRCLEAQPRPNTTSQWSEAVEIGTESMSPGLEASLRAVLELSTMKPGWDGYRSPSIGAAAISGARNLLVLVEGLGLPRPHVAPVPGGGIQIEWARGSKELEIDFRHDGTMGFLRVEPNSEDAEGLLTFQDQQLFELLRWLAE